MKTIFENWNKFLREDDDGDDRVLDLAKELDSGFCEFNPLINQYAQYSPENLAEMLIFVVATQQQRWYDVVPKFVMLISHVKQNDGLLDAETATTDEKGKLRYAIPREFSQLTLGFRKNAIEEIWQGREKTYAAMKPLFDTYNTSGEDSLARENAMFQIYLELIKTKGLGLPKAAFASQLIIGRLGCIDSINLNLYKGLDPEGKLLSYDKKSGRPSFKTPGVSRKNDIIQVTKGGVRLAEKYVDFLRQIAKLTGSTEAKISQQLWDSWVELVAMKINKTGDLKVKMPGGEEFVVPNDYSKSTKGAGVNPSATFRKKYIGNITGRDISRQHYPPEMNEGVEMWSEYFYKVLSE